jgi:NAD(P)-dependent dehydrogenase (short-subunit alcohol dehydrogenase family)
LERGQRKVIANISSGLASFTMDYGMKAASYSITKAALNMLVRHQHSEFCLLGLMTWVR